MQDAPHLRDVLLARVGRRAASSSPNGIGSTSTRRAPGIRDDCSPHTKTWSNSSPFTACSGSTATASSRCDAPSRSSSSPSPPASATAASQRANSRGVACGARRTYDAASSPTWAKDTKPLNNVGLRREDLLAPQPQPLDQPVHEQVRARRVQRGRRLAVQPQERQDALARLRRQLRRLGRRDQPGHHVQLAPLGDLDAAREVDRVQLDRRPRQRAHHRARVVRVDQQPQPRQDVADLGLPEERRRARQPERQRALLQGDRQLLALGPHRPHEHADPPRRDALAHQPLDRLGDRLGLRAIRRAAPPAARRPRRRGRPRRSRTTTPPAGRRSARRPPRRRRPRGPGSARSGRGRQLRTSARRPRDDNMPRSRAATPRGSSTAWSSSAVTTSDPCSRASNMINLSCAGVRSSTSSTSTCRQRPATRARTCGRCSSSDDARSTSSPKSSSPCSSISRSWASYSAANSRSRAAGVARRPAARPPTPRTAPGRRPPP